MTQALCYDIYDVGLPNREYEFQHHQNHKPNEGGAVLQMYAGRIHS